MTEPEFAGDEVTVIYLLLGLKSLKLEGDIIPLKPISSGADPQPFPHPSELGTVCLPIPGSSAPASGLALPFLLHLCFQKTPGNCTEKERPEEHRSQPSASPREEGHPISSTTSMR